MTEVDPGVALDLLSRSLALLVSLIGIVVAVNQLTLPTILRNREKWLRSVLDTETNKFRRALLVGQLDRTTARLIGGLVVPARYYFEAGFWLLLSPLQVYLWTRGDPSLWNVVYAVVISVVVLSAPIRRAIRLLAERYRVVHEYESGAAKIRLARTGILAQMEGGTRNEFLLAALMALSINVVGAGVSLVILQFDGWGAGVGFAGVAGAILSASAIRTYVLSRASIFGPWPKDHNVHD